MQTWHGKRMKFQKADFSESAGKIDNPSCGWYHVYSFAIQELSQMSLKEAEGSLNVDSKYEQLVLVLIDIGAFRTRVMPKEAICYIEQIFQLFHSYKKQIILRVVYDRAGKGMEREPMERSLIETHMEQIGDIVLKYAEDILVIQGIFVGNWGEMHGSKFLDIRDMRELLCCLHRSVKGSCCLAVRTPSQWRKIMDSSRVFQELKGNMALFNDGLFGSSTDLGTYGEGNTPVRGCGPAGRAEELEWQSTHMENLPNGGEAVAAKKLVGYREAAEEMRKIHLCYLNSVWQEELLEFWRDEKVKEPGCWMGFSGYDYIGRHLGYRFVIRDARMFSLRCMYIELENIGFAGLYEEAECILIIETDDGNIIQKIVDTDPCRWKSGQRKQFTVTLPDVEGKIEGLRIYLKLQRKRDGRSLYFANKGAGDKMLLGRTEKKGFFRINRRER